MQRTYPGAPAGDGVEGGAGLERAEGVADLLRHALDAVAVVDKGVAAGLVEEREQVAVRCAPDGDDGVDVGEAGELDGEKAEGRGGAVDDQRFGGAGGGWGGGPG